MNTDLYIDIKFHTRGKMLKAIIKKEVCEKLHPIYKVKSGVAYRVIQLDDTMTVRQKNVSE